MSNSKLENKYSKSSFFRFLLNKNLDNFYFLGFFGGLFFICGLLFFGKILDHIWGQIFSGLIILICLILVTKNFFLSIFEFYKKDSYNSFLVSNFIYKTKLIKFFSKDKILSLEAKLNFVKDEKSDIDINEEINFLSIANSINDLKIEADNMYTKDYFIKHEKYELLFPCFKKLFNSFYIIKTLYEDYFWNTKSDFNQKALQEESNLDLFNKLIEDLLSETIKQQMFLLEKLKQRKILPLDFIMPQ